MSAANSKLWEWMEAQTAEASERGLQTLLIEVVDKIESVMECEGLTRAEVARRAGLKREYVSRILNNPSNVTLATLVRLANAVSHQIYVDLLPSIERPSAYYLIDEDHREENWSDDADHQRIALAA